MKIDYSKPVRTKSKQPVTILFTNGRGEFSVGGYVGDSSCLSLWTKDGIHCISEFDLENAPVRKTVEFWVNIYPGRLFGSTYPTQQAADENQALYSNRIACKKFSYEVEESVDGTIRVL